MSRSGAPKDAVLTHVGVRLIYGRNKLGEGNKTMATVTADFKKGRLTGDLVKENRLTVWMRLLGGRIVKRHIRKHRVDAV